MRFVYLGHPRLTMLNEMLNEPVMFAPSETVKVMTFAAAYGGSPNLIHSMDARMVNSIGSTGCSRMWS